MTPPIIHVESDFATPDETLQAWRHRLHPLPAKRDIAGFVAIGIGGAIAFLIVLAASGWMAAYT